MRTSPKRWRTANFAADLYYRLNVFPVTIPPLRERREDIPLLVRYFAQKYARRMKRPIDNVPVKAMAALSEYHWPGNVRELENFIERAVILSRGAELQIPLAELKQRTTAARSLLQMVSPPSRTPSGNISFAPSVRPNG